MSITLMHIKKFPGHMEGHNTGIKYCCNFFVVPGNGSALLGLPDCDWLQLLSIKCQTTNDQHKRGQINKQTK